MSFARKLPLLALAAALALAGCGKAPVSMAGHGATQIRSGGMHARGAGGYDDPVLLEDFDLHDGGIDDFTPIVPENHPFFNSVIFTLVNIPGHHNSLEMLAPAGEAKPRKGFFVSQDAGYRGSFLDPNAQDQTKAAIAPHIRLSWRWAVNGAPTTDAAIFAEAVFILKSKSLGNVGICYAWANDRYCKNQVLKTQIGSGPDAIPARILVVNTGLGLAQPCGANELPAMYAASTIQQQYLEQDWDYINHVMPFQSADMLGAGDAPAAGPDRTTCANPSPNVAPTVVTNTDLSGVMACGGGADMPQVICAHSILDDMQMELKWDK